MPSILGWVILVAATPRRSGTRRTDSCRRAGGETPGGRRPGTGGGRRADSPRSSWTRRWGAGTAGVGRCCGTATSSSGWATRGRPGPLPVQPVPRRGRRSRYSHAGIVAVEDGAVLYDCTKAGVRRSPSPCGPWTTSGRSAAKRLRPENRAAIPGVLAYCREVFYRQVPFDYHFSLDDSALYCLEMTEKAYPLPGPGPVRAGPARRHGERRPVPDLHRAVRGPLAPVAGPTPHAGTGRLHAWQRPPRPVGIAPAGARLPPRDLPARPGSPLPPCAAIQRAGRPGHARPDRGRAPGDRPVASDPARDAPAPGESDD